MKLPVTPTLPNAEKIYDLFIALEGEPEEDEEFLIWQNELNHLILIIGNIKSQKTNLDDVDVQFNV